MGQEGGGGEDTYAHNRKDAPERCPKKKKRPAPAVGKKKQTMLTFCLITVQFSTQFGRRGGYQKHRVDTASFLTTEEAAVPPAPATECNLSLQGGFLSSASLEKKKKIQ